VLAQPSKISIALKKSKVFSSLFPILFEVGPRAYFIVLKGRILREGANPHKHLLPILCSLIGGSSYLHSY
jgi:hypothetical protein